MHRIPGFFREPQYPLILFMIAGTSHQIHFQFVCIHMQIPKTSHQTFHAFLFRNLTNINNAI